MKTLFDPRRTKLHDEVHSLVAARSPEPPGGASTGMPLFMRRPRPDSAEAAEREARETEGGGAAPEAPPAPPVEERAEDGRRGAAPRRVRPGILVEEEDAEAAEGDAEEAAGEDESGPIEVERPEPPAAPRLELPYAGPAALPTEIVKLVPPEQGQPPDRADVEAVARARVDFGIVVSRAREKHEEMITFLRGLEEGLRDHYTRVVERVDAPLTAAAETIDQRVEQGKLRVDEAADAALTAIDEAAASARRRVFGAASSAKRRIRANASTAESQANAIIEDLAADYTGLLEACAVKITQEGQAAERAVRGLAGSITYDGTKLQKALNEGKRKEAEKISTRFAPQINTGFTGAAGQYRGAKETVKTQIKTQSPLGQQVMEQTSRKLNEDGGKAVDKAKDTALKGLKDQTKAAREAVRDMRRSSKERLTAERKSARARLAGHARELLHGARGETGGALQGVEAAARSGLPAFGNVVAGSEKSLRKAGDSGPKPLAEGARGAARDLPGKLAGIAGSQREKLQLTADNTRGSVRGREDRGQSGITTDRDAALETLDRALDESVVLIEESTTQHTDGFVKVAVGVAQAGDQWSMPLAEKFAQGIEATKSAQRETFDTWKTDQETGRDAFVNQNLVPFKTPLVKFREPLDAAGQAVESDITRRLGLLEAALDYGVIDKVDEGGVTAALRGLTFLRGQAFEEWFNRTDAAKAHGNLSASLSWAVGDEPDNYEAAINYLYGNTAAGAAAELRASLHWYNDEEARIEEVMRSLTDEERAELQGSESGREALAEVRDSLGGTDLNVFTALEDGNHARADAFRMRARIDEARRDGDEDALHTVLAEYSRASGDRGREGETSEERRTRVQQELAFILQGGDANDPTSTISAEDAATAVETYALRPIEVQHHHGEGPPVTTTLTVTGANRDLASALIRTGEGSVDARVARLGVEAQRSGKPNVENLDTALHDPRLLPDSGASAEERRRAQEDRDHVFQGFAERYGDTNQCLAADAARDLTRDRLRTAFGDDALGADLATAMVEEDPMAMGPGANGPGHTAALAMMYAARGTGTNEALAFRFTERLNRDQIADMRGSYRHLASVYPSAGSSGDLDRDMGTFAAGRDAWFTEFSGDERLRLERALRGRPRNDLERAEASAFAAQQQRDETGSVGSGLAGGTRADLNLSFYTNELTSMTGAQVRIDENGEAIWTDTEGNRLSRPGGPNFNERGEYVGPNAEQFRMTVQMTQISAENYAAKIDQFANFAATAIAVLGAVAAAVVSVATGGLASPLLMAAIAGVTGLASMGARAAISGGRYGWEAAASDLGMTAVQALTAGVGQQLSLASRGISAAARPQMLQAFMAGRLPASALPAMGRLTGSVLGDQVLIAGIGGGMGSLGQTALDEKTWEKGLGKAFESMLLGTMRGILSGAATGFVSNKFEDIPVGRAAGVGAQRPTFGSVMGASTSSLARGTMRGTSSAIGGFVGREVELGFDALTGRYKGDAGDAFVSGLEAAGQSSVQDSIAGGFEAGAQRRIDTRQRSAPAAGPEPTTPRPAGEPEGPAPRPVAEPEAPEIAAPRLPPIEAPPAAPGPRPPAAPEVVSTPRLPVAEPAPETAPTPRPTAAEEPETPAAPRLTEEEEPGTVPSARPLAAGPVPELVGAGAGAPKEFAEGAAAGVRGSAFQGDAAIPGAADAASTRTVKGAVRRLLGTASEIAGFARLPNARDPSRVAVRTRSGDEVTVQVRLSGGPLPAEDGVSPVARFSRDPSTGEYVIHVSAGAQRQHVERAIAHELAEIRAGHRQPHADDVLTPGRRVAPPEEGAPPPRLSPHDEGRLAELGVIARELRNARTSGERARLLAEAEQLAVHLGLAGATRDSAARRVLAMGALDGSPEVQALLLEALLPHAPAAAMLREVAERRRASGRSGVVDEDMLDLPGEPAMGMRRGDPRPGRSRLGATPADAQRIAGSLRRASRREFGRMLQAALLDPGLHNALTQKTLEYLTPEQVEFVVRTGRLPRDLDFHHLMAVADFPEFAHRGDVGLGLPKDVHLGVGHGDDTTRPLEAATFIDPDTETRPAFHNDPEATPRNRATRDEVAQGSRSSGDVDQDLRIQLQRDQRRLEGRVERLETEIARVEAQAARAPADESPRRAEQRAERLGDLRGRLGVTRRHLEAIPVMLEAVPPRPAAQPAPEAPPAATPTRTMAPEGEVGTAAGIARSRGRGDALESPRPGAAEEARQAARGFVTGEGPLRGAVRLPDPEDPSQVVLRTENGQEVKVRVQIVDTMDPAADGVIPMGRIMKGDTDGEYVVLLSSRMMEGNLERALAHELTEIRHQHGTSRVPDALRAGGFGSQATRRGDVPVLSPHDHGRLAELDVLARQVATARAAGDETRVAVLHDDTQRLLAELGMVGGTRAAEARRSLALDTLDEGGAAGALLADQAVAARRNPFLQIPPEDPRGFLDNLLARLEHARALGDVEGERRVLEMARHSMSFAGGNIEVTAPGGGSIKYGVEKIAELAARPDRPRARLIHELIEHRRAHPPETDRRTGRPRLVDPGSLDPDTLAAVRRNFADYKLDPEQYQDWADFRDRRLKTRRGEQPTDEAKLREAYRRWTSGEEIAKSGRPASVLTGTRRPDVVPHPPLAEGMHPEFRPVSARDAELAAARRGMTVDQMIEARDAAIQRRRAIDEDLRLRRDELARTVDPDERKRIGEEIDGLVDRRNKLIPQINTPTEWIGEAAGIRFARGRYGLDDQQEAGIFVGKGRDVPDLIFIDPRTRRVVVVEAKGNEATLQSRRSADNTRMVQQGTFEYLQSLAHAMQTRSSDPRVRQLGKELELALEEGRVDYHSVRQPVNDDGTLGDPTVTTFDPRREGS